MCDAVVLRHQAQQVIDVEGAVIEQPVYDRHGDLSGTRVVRSQWMLVWKDANDVIARVGARFGLSPSDRAGLKIEKEPIDSHASRFLTRPSR